MFAKRISCVLPVLFLSGCVTSGRYDAAVMDAKRAHSALSAEHARNARELSARDRGLAQATVALSAAAEREEDQARRIEKLQSDQHACAKQLDDGNALNQSLRGELERAGKNVEQLLSAKGSLAAALEQTRARLDELRRAQTATEAREAQFREIAKKLQRMVDAGQLRILLRNGRMVLVLPADVLFDSGRARLSAQGRESVMAVAQALASVDGRRFQVAGHTDNQPIRWSGFSSNWQLSTERALSVVSVLIESGVKPELLSAAGYGEFEPVEPNDIADGRARNRRIEISLQPNIDEIVNLPDVR